MHAKGRTVATVSAMHMNMPFVCGTTTPGVRPVRHPPAVCVVSQEAVDAVGQDAPRLVCWTGKDISFPSTVAL